MSGSQRTTFEVMERSQQTWIETADGCRLDADLVLPADESTALQGGIVVAHPHPLYGGNRHHPIVGSLTTYATKLGWVSIRFDFRGTGRSTGEHGDGLSEVADMEAALGHLCTFLPDDIPLVSAGYSFGAVMALRAKNPRVTHRVAVAAPLAMMADQAPPEEPTLLLVPTHDQYTSPEKAQALIESWPAATQLHPIEGADHFLSGFADYVSTRVFAWLTEQRCDS